MNSEERVLSKIVPGDLSVVTIEETEWLCCFNEEELTIEYGVADNMSLKDWFLAWNVESSRKFKMSKLTSYTVRALEPHELEDFEMVKAKLLRAKMFAVNYWENEVYEKHIP